MNDRGVTDRLRETGLVPTLQRIAIVKYLDSVDIHPTADDVFRAVSTRHPTISKATVYNGLRALVDVGLVSELTIEKDAARYDLCGGKPHGHFRCCRCRRLYDVDAPTPIRTGDLVDGHQVASVSTYLYGVCAECLAGDRGERRHA
ncbi:MAG: transcriptional repressor [Candidatus Bipolaricaulota bacterium]|nr:MAG: transcriptional repressor [Candidatus Bipolaricaulota bacterium]